MAGFKFSLEQVLTYRGQLKEQAQVALAKIQAELNREQERAEELRKLVEESENRVFSLSIHDGGERWLLEHFIKGLRADESMAHMRLRMLTQQRNEAQVELGRRAKDEKVLDKLKEKQAERHFAEERLKEMRTYDETAAIRFKPASF